MKTAVINTIEVLMSNYGKKNQYITGLTVMEGHICHIHIVFIQYIFRRNKYPYNNHMKSDSQSGYFFIMQYLMGNDCRIIVTIQNNAFLKKYICLLIYLFRPICLLCYKKIHALSNVQPIHIFIKYCIPRITFKLN